MCHHFMGSAGSFKRMRSLSKELIFLWVTAAASFGLYTLHRVSSYASLDGLDYAIVALRGFLHHILSVNKDNQVYLIGDHVPQLGFLLLL